MSPFSREAFWPPQTCLNYKTRSGWTIQPSLRLSSLWLLRIITPKTRATCPQSRQSGRRSRTRARAPTLAAADEHPEDAGEFQHHFACRIGAVGRGSRLRRKNKGRERRHESWLRSSAVTVLRWRLRCLGSCLRCLPGGALPLQARSPWSALWTQMIVWNDPPKRVMNTHLWKSDGNEAAFCESPWRGPPALNVLFLSLLFRKTSFTFSSSWDDNHYRPWVWAVCKARRLPNIVKMQQNQPMLQKICLSKNSAPYLMCT